MDLSMFSKEELSSKDMEFCSLAYQVGCIEVADFLESDSFINGLRRFVCRRGPVTQTCCDRGTNSIGTKTKLKKAIDERKIKVKLVKDNIKWIKKTGIHWQFWRCLERQIRWIRNVINLLI